MDNKIINIIREEIRDLLEKIDVSGLEDITLKTPAPQLGKRFQANIEKDKIEVSDDNFIPNKMYDYVIDIDGELFIGTGHYKLAKKADKIKAAGEIKINKNGKVTYLNNESGHYEPTKKDLDNITAKFRELNILSDEPTIEKRY